MAEGTVAEWTKLLDVTRRSHLEGSRSDGSEFEYRTAWERDYDRILFSTPVRRLADKTQVFPLEQHASVRTRLTHSHEVSNLARGMGVFLAHKHEPTMSVPGAGRTFPPLLAAIGLAHDLGNPPFGHQGEVTIQKWFKDHDYIFEKDKNGSEKEKEDVAQLTNAMKADFLKFEGNAQTFRVLTRLQTLPNDRGMNLTASTLAAVMKYPVASSEVNKSKPSTKKPGFFQSERDVVEFIRERTGLRAGVRHPLTWVMEACDDIAYLILDAEDAIKKGIVSVSDLFAHLDARGGGDALTASLAESGWKLLEENRKWKLSPAELNDATAQRFRVEVIARLVECVQSSVRERWADLLSGELPDTLLNLSEARRLAETLREFDEKHAYRNREVRKLELEAYNTTYALMDMLWRGITEREDFSEPDSRRTNPFAEYAYTRISENYRLIFEGKTTSARTLPVRYREAQLLADMVAGMTDSYVLDLCAELEAFHVGPSVRK